MPNPWCLFQHHFNSLSPAVCPTIQFISDTNHLELLQTPQVKGSVPQDCPTSDAKWKQVPRLPTVLLSQIQIWICSHPTELRKTMHFLLPGYYKGYNSGTATRRRSIGKGIGAGCVELPLPLWDTTLPVSPHVHQPRSWTPWFRAFYGDFIT